MGAKAAKRGRLILGVGAAIAAILGAAVAGVLAFAPDLLALSSVGEKRQVGPPEHRNPVDQDSPSLLLIALDGVDRRLLYEMIERGQLPGFSALIAQAGKQFPHAHLDHTLLSVLPSSTIAAWATVFTGVPPHAHGVAGNEYFVREKRFLAAPAPVSIVDPAPVLKTYTEGYANDLLEVPTIYHQLRSKTSDASSWVSMSQFYAGANELLLADRTVVGDAFKALLSGAVQKDDPGVFKELDEEVIETLIDRLGQAPAPRIITLYLVGTDHYAHVAESGPDSARREYLRDVVDPALNRLREALDGRNALDNRYVLITSDHGHTEVLHDEKHALGTDDDDELPSVLRGAGFRLRPFELEVDASHDFQSVLAYGGALAYVYLADRSTCVEAGTACDFSRPPRFTEDVLVVADAFYEANRTGKLAPGLKGTLDMVLTRHPRPFAQDDEPFEVYVGGGKLQPVSEYLRSHPHPTYVAVESRLADLAAGRFGERAGDILLVAHNGDVDDPAGRYYFAGLYHSWHGSPSKDDSEVPLIISHPTKSGDELKRMTREALGDEPRQMGLAKLIFSMLGVRP
jgi:hypothetical protein